MKKLALYHDVDPFKCEVVRQAIKAKAITDGEVICGDIKQLEPRDLMGFRRFHAFCGGGFWDLALNQSGWEDSRPVWTGSCPCFAAGIMIMTLRGQVPIEKINVGDLVLTHMGRWRRVEAVMQSEASTILVKGQGSSGITTTENHPFLARKATRDWRRKSSTYGKVIFGSDDEWISAESLVGKYWALPVEFEVPPINLPTRRKNGWFFDASVKGYRAKGEKDGRPVYLGVFGTAEKASVAVHEAIKNERIDVRGADAFSPTSLGAARFLGYWLGDGWVSRENVFLCGSLEDHDLLEEIFRGANLPGKSYSERTSSRIRCGSQHLSAWLTENFGHGAANKQVPLWVYGMPTDYKKAFMDGYFEADGHPSIQSKGNGEIKSATTVSKALAIGLRILLNQTGKSVSVRLRIPRLHCVIEGRTVIERGAYVVTEYQAARSFRFDQGKGWGRVRLVNPTGRRETVFNLEVEGDHSYIADGVIVHNCPSFSAAGKGEGFDDPRHLWPAWFRLIRECRPAVCIGEQVDSAIGHGWLDLLGMDLEGEGYAVAAAVLPAASVGAPHKRNRLYFVADRDGTGLQERFSDGGVSSPPMGTNSRQAAERGGESCGMADADGRQPRNGAIQRSGEHGQQPEDGGAGPWKSYSEWFGVCGTQRLSRTMRVREANRAPRMAMGCR